MALPRCNSCWPRASTGAAREKAVWVVAVVFTVWLGANVAINSFNKYVLSRTHFRFPILLTATNKLVKHESHEPWTRSHAPVVQVRRRSPRRRGPAKKTDAV